MFGDRADILKAVLRLRNAREEAMGEEADRLIDNQLHGHMPKTVKTKSGYSRSEDRRVGKVASNTWTNVDGSLLCNVRLLCSGDGAVYVCSVKENLSIGTVVIVDSGWYASELRFNTDTTVFYEGFNDDTHSNEHPSAVVTTDVTCSYCQQTGLHWSGKKGVSLCLRDSNGFKHDCGRSKVTINL